jgi:ribosome maturation factor RimP
MPKHATPEQARLTDEIRTLTNEVLRGTSWFVVDLEVRGHKGTRVIELYVDGDEGIGHDDLATISRELGFLLDVEDVVAGGHKLNVSSPGIKRPLTHKRQYPKNVGRTLRVRYDPEPEANEDIVVGTLTAAHDDRIELERSDGDLLTIPYDAIREARFELPW